MYNYSEQDFIADLINEREKRMNEWNLGIVAEYNCEKDGMEKKEDSECCCCLETKTCVKLPNCDHFICPKCYHKIYRGFISDEFYSNYRRPCFGPEKPNYPYKNAEENREIYATLLSGNDNPHERWFITFNEELYNCMSRNKDFIEGCIKVDEQMGETDYNIKQWFYSNEKIKKYQEDLVHYYNEYKLFEEKTNLYERLREEDRQKNCVKKCPLCRQ